MEYVPNIGPASSLEQFFLHQSSSPITKIPPELLGEIFTKYLEDEPANAADNVRKRPLVSPFTTANPIALGRVCSLWRTISVNMSSLWSSIVVLKTDLVPVELVELWLERAYGAPLDLDLRVPPWPVTDAPYEIVERFFLRSASWRSIQFQVVDEDLHEIMTLVNSSSPCSRLQSMSLAVTETASPAYEGAGRWYFPHVEKFARFCHASPSLRKITIPPITGCLFFDHTPTNQLTSLVITASFISQDFFRLLSLSPLLEDLSVLFSFNVKPISHHKSCTLGRLRKLHLRSTDLANGILHFLILPALQSLSIDWMWGTILKDTTALQDLLRKSVCHLQHLTLQYPRSEEDLESHLLIPELVSLQSLFIRHIEITDRTIDLLLEKDLNGGFLVLPSLGKLELGPWKASDGHIRRFIKERCRLPSQSSHPGVIIDFRPYGCTPYGPIDRAFMEETYPWRSLDNPCSSNMLQ